MEAKSNEEFVCYYCGKRADTVDHVVPQSLLRHLCDLSDQEITKKFLKSRALKVDSCLECNQLASNSYQDTLSERKKYVKDKLRKRYKKYLDLPIWQEEELAELSYRLRVHVEDGLKLKALVKKRLAW